MNKWYELFISNNISHIYTNRNLRAMIHYLKNNTKEVKIVIRSKDKKEEVKKEEVKKEEFLKSFI
jgi:hypothetical protein